MKTRALNVTFDGVSDVKYHDFVADGERYERYESFIDRYLDNYSTGNPTSLTAHFVGANWHVNFLRNDNYGASDGRTTIRDGDAGTARSVNFMELGGNSNVDLISTSVYYMSGGGGAKHDVSLGAGYFETVSLSSARNILSTGDGLVVRISLDGTNTATLGAGGAHFVTASGGDSVIKTGAG